MHTFLKSILLLGMAWSLTACGGKSRSWQKNPVDEYIRDMSDVPTFSILLHDMDVQGNFVKSYMHKYKVITPGKDSIPEVETTEWLEVPEKFFFAHADDMGMEIAAKGPDGKVTKTASPAGFTNYVGNPNYGEWRTDASGNSFWAFYGRYRLMSDVFGLGFRPVYRTGYYDYYDNYYGRRSYYGGSTSSGTPRYGTRSDYIKQTRPNFYQRRQAKNGFSRSTRSTSNARSSRTSRSSSRYSSSSSSSRSRGGGFGK